MSDDGKDDLNVKIKTIHKISANRSFIQYRPNKNKLKTQIFKFKSVIQLSEFFKVNLDDGKDKDYGILMHN